VSRAFALVRLAGAGDLFMAGGPERMLFAAVLIWIGFRRNVLPCGALALLERVRVGIHAGAFLVLDFFAVAAFESPALFRSASFRSMGMPCFLSRSAKASSANS